MDDRLHVVDQRADHLVGLALDDLQLGLLGVQHLDPLWRQQRGHQLCLQQIGEHADGEVGLSHAAETVQGMCRNRCVGISVRCAW